MTDTSARPRKTSISRVIGVLTDPGATFEDIVLKPDAAGPLLLIFITGALSVAPMVSALRSIPETSPTGVPMPPTGFTIVTGVIGLLVGLLAWWPIRALVFMAVGSLLGGKASFSQSLAVSGYLNVSEALSALVLAIAVATTGRAVTLGLGMFLPQEHMATPLGVLLNSVNVFGLIYIVLSTVALAKLWKSSTYKAAAATIVLWLIVVGISAGSAYLGSQLSGMVQMTR